MLSSFAFKNLASQGRRQTRLLFGQLAHFHSAPENDKSINLFISNDQLYLIVNYSYREAIM